ncbi:lytic transglycosylase domain-containing protein [Citrobacter rodentium]|uniref:Lytic transglycosylase domain-containing protein n=1 Tax=Citrobacter rodentium TaxID=67825 RepID=A0A482PRF8_CITRO|nr:lytic transglycosylase domain-containing protein [Citrobacter rodentium]KIQ51471.1 hypothetical protein TA05_10055 [Citrobacter rodentium]QBY30449.1 lytic transglycosylase domain-containing protein [Citrobacter rodentium]UHO32180.1 lytic transglycosylase domain-containing protein [Citrobacter rodentium NBRC 105723 = DSM 16636]HAT8012643.1 lytic transglycosylase domain-containing protein [Citrobacter rodentium NBRC 105723 = DSM 16636]HAT8017943.1 lytic transglycosylase domain-containing prot
MLDVLLLASQCAPNFPPEILLTISKVESGHNPYAIGVVDGYLARQPGNKDEALATANMLHKEGWNFSMGIAQINLHNLAKYNLTFDSVFDPCDNLRIAAAIYNDCFQRASLQYRSERDAQLASYSCYYSGNFTRGFKAEGKDGLSYVDKIIAAMPASTADKSLAAQPIPVIASRKKKAVTQETQTQDARLSRKQKTGVKELRGN